MCHDIVVAVLELGLNGKVGINKLDLRDDGAQFQYALSGFGRSKHCLTRVC